ncbi:exonuclease II Exo2 [Microbotryomycetes sp. JL221]|nr:exonuclease II Exo2 [Microbotryomycetes sp. JL221]
MQVSQSSFGSCHLDMNGIIHNCSHPNDSDASFRISEEDIFLAIFAYISHLFAVIKPQKLFFLAIDGVAPRAKMNQQRSRRFRTAKEAKEVLDKAKAKGEELPEGDGFDSNCITPGTPFMARLSQQLKYFLAKKVSEDADWRGVEIVLSGHEVPGEGEHKIMEYIRLKKAQPGYDANTRHCLYGLDADLIMLGLLSHDPHFCLLREEVKFGPQRGKSKGGLESQNFFLLHLSLFREYLDLEFSSLKSSSPPLPFAYDLERIIDDFILLNIFVGNDFLPHLPSLHINDGALGLLFDIYKRVLPTAGGYINEYGKLNLKRLQLVLDELALDERDHYEREVMDSSWLHGKQGKGQDAPKQRQGLALTKEQQRLFKLVRGFIFDNLRDLSPNAHLDIPQTLSARDKRFLNALGEQLKLDVFYDQFDPDDMPIIRVCFDDDLVEMAREENEEGAEWRNALTRVINKYDRAEQVIELSEEELQEERNRQVDAQFIDWKDKYYQEKLEFSYHDTDELDKITFRYIEGLQWVLHYYYDGVASWSWFYDYHYAPKVSDLVKASTYEFDFELGKPFRPFEQLMGVLPDLSSAHIPLAFRDLMSDPTSPIIDFYPTDFRADLNGKKQDWEAVVKIPFIDQDRLLSTMASREPRLTKEERQRNSFGNSWRFVYDANKDDIYPSSLPGFFPDLVHCRTRVEAFELPSLEGGLSLVKGLAPGVLLGKDAISGFPSLHTIPHFGTLGYHGVNVFQSDSKRETMVVSIENEYEGLKSEDIASLVLGKRVFVGYPYLQEALVTGISDELFRYEGQGGGVQVSKTPLGGSDMMSIKRAAEKLEYTHSKHKACMIGHVEVLVHARLIKGRSGVTSPFVQALKLTDFATAGLKRLDDGSQVKEFGDNEAGFALQTIVSNVSNEDGRFMEREALPVELEFAQGSKVFFLGAAVYGVPAQVIGYDTGNLMIRIAYFPSEKAERQIFRSKIATSSATNYTPAHALNRVLKMSGLSLAKITSSVIIHHKDQKFNIGLNLKFEAKGQKVLGYSRKGESGWEFSDDAIDLIREYREKFPEIVGGFDNRRGDLTKATDFFEPSKVEQRVSDLKQWIKEKGVRDFEKVPLWSEQLDKNTVLLVETLADRLTSSKGLASIKQAAINGIPRAALLKPSHAASRLRDQRFSLGDRVVAVSESGSVPLAAQGVVVGIQTGLIDVVFDVQFIGGTTLGDRCSSHRGASVAPNTLLNLTDPQCIVQTGNARSPSPDTHKTSSAGRGKGRGRGQALFTRGPAGGPAILPARGLPAGGFHPAPSRGAPQGRAIRNRAEVQHPARDFDANAYGAVARGQKLATKPAAAPATQQQRLGGILGINGNTKSTSTNGSSNSSSQRERQDDSLGIEGILSKLSMQQQEVNNSGPSQPSHRGGRGGFQAVPNGRGVNVPPPPALVNDSGGFKRGGGRGGGRGGRGSGGPRGGAPRTNHGAPREALSS